MDGESSLEAAAAVAAVSEAVMEAGGNGLHDMDTGNGKKRGGSRRYGGNGPDIAASHKKN